MLTLLQRVERAQVSVNGTEVASIGAGLLALACVVDDDTDEDIFWTAKKMCALRIFEDDQGKMNRSVVDQGGAALIVSQFTLAANLRKGNRPSFQSAMKPPEAETCFEQFVSAVGSFVPAQKGIFGADMKVSLVNDGPVTIWIDSRIARSKPSQKSEP